MCFCWEFNISDPQDFYLGSTCEVGRRYVRLERSEGSKPVSMIRYVNVGIVGPNPVNVISWL